MEAGLYAFGEYIKRLQTLFHKIKKTSHLGKLSA